MRAIRLACLIAVASVALGCGSPSGPASDEKTGAPPTYRIVYNVLHDETAMELDGSGKRNLTRHPAVDWAYAAQGDRIFLVSDRDDEKRKYHLYEMGPDGGRSS